jgi:hypothetical protein
LAYKTRRLTDARDKQARVVAQLAALGGLTALVEHWGVCWPAGSSPNV